jgi:hypothetical protein
MASVKLVPAVCKGESPSFEGFITMKMPNFDEKYGFIEDLDLELDDEGKVSAGNAKKGLSMIRKAVKASKAFYQHVELKHLESGKVFGSFDDLSNDDKAHVILIEVATALMAGLPMGND